MRGQAERLMPMLQEMLDDPMVRLVMRRDGVARDHVEGLVRSLARREGREERLLKDGSELNREGAGTGSLSVESGRSSDLLARSLRAARRQLAANHDSPAAD